MGHVLSYQSRRRRPRRRLRRRKIAVSLVLVSLICGVVVGITDRAQALAYPWSIGLQLSLFGPVLLGCFIAALQVGLLAPLAIAYSPRRNRGWVALGMVAGPQLAVGGTWWACRYVSGH